MKNKTLSIFILTLIVIFVPACVKGNEETASPPEELNIEPEISQTLEENASDADPCNNVLYPLAVGNNWIYETQFAGENGQLETSKYTWSVSEKTDNGVVLGTLFNDTGVVLSANVECADGAIQNFPMSQMNMVLEGVQGDINYDHVSGVFMPSLKEFEDANWQNNWDTIINSSGLITAIFEGETTTIELVDSPITMHWQVVEKDASVDVPAGSFDNAVKINQDLTFEIKSLKMNFNGQPLDISTTMVFNSDMYFVPYIGLVKTDVTSVSLSLYGTDFPLEAIGGNELISSNLIK